MAADRPLWTCPRCGKRFVTRNMWHSCVRVTVAEHLRGRPRHVVELYRATARLVRALGPDVRVVCSKTRIGWMVRARFAGVGFREDHLVLGFWLKRPIESPRLEHEHLGRSDHLYELRIRSLADLDEQLRGWLGESYLVGRQEWVPARTEGATGDRPLRS